MKHKMPKAAPRFCSECRAPATVASWDRPFCAHCGGSLLEQGYCPICEDHWRLPAGDRCPKHDTPLEDRAPDPAQRAWSGSGPSALWKTVRDFPHTMAAAGARIRLEAEGIPTFIEGERMGSPSMYRVATGGVKLQVPSNMVDEARIILDQTWISRPPDDPDEDLEDAWDDLSPPASDAARSVASLIHLVEALLLFLVLAPVALWFVARWLGVR